MSQRSANAQTSQRGSMPVKSSNKSMSTVDLLNSTNPEIFDTRPRRGNYMQHDDSNAQGLDCECPATSSWACPKDVCSTTSIGSTHSRSSRYPRGFEKNFPKAPKPAISREYRLNKSMTNMAFDTPPGSDDEGHTAYSPGDDHKLMLATTVSTVMLMASGYGNIPQEHLNWTEQYLECVKDSEEKYPYNILGILNHIMLLRQQNKVPQTSQKKCCGTCVPKNTKSNSKIKSKEKSKGNIPKTSRSPSPTASRTSAAAPAEVSAENVRVLTTVKAPDNQRRK